MEQQIFKMEKEEFMRLISTRVFYPPVAVSDDVKRFCKIFKGKPRYVSVHSIPDAPFNECVNVVAKMIEHNGGKAINGWAIWEWPTVLLEAEFHVIWQSANGKLELDVTPKRDGEKRILFVPDPSVEWQGVRIPNQQMALTENPVLDEFLATAKRRIELMGLDIGNYKPTKEFINNEMQFGMAQAVLIKHYTPMDLVAKAAEMAKVELE